MSLISWDVNYCFAGTVMISNIWTVLDVYMKWIAHLLHKSYLPTPRRAVHPVC